MIVAKVKEWKDLSREQKRQAWDDLWKNCIEGLNYHRLCDAKSAFANFLKVWYFDECGQRIFVFNSILKGEIINDEKR